MTGRRRTWRLTPLGRELLTAVAPAVGIVAAMYAYVTALH